MAFTEQDRFTVSEGPNKVEYIFINGVTTATNVVPTLLAKAQHAKIHTKDGAVASAIGTATINISDPEAPGKYINLAGLTISAPNNEYVVTVWGY